MKAIAPRLLRTRPFLRRGLVLFPSSADSKSSPLSRYIPNSKSEAVTSSFARLNDFRAYLEGDPTPRKLLKESMFTVQRRDGHTLNHPNEKLDGGKAKTMNMDETAISIIEAMDEQPDLTLNERFILSRKLMGNPNDYALFKAYKGEKRAIFLQSLLKRFDIPGAIDMNDPNEKLDRRQVLDCKCRTLLMMSEDVRLPQTMNLKETVIAIVEAMDEQSDLTLDERFVLSLALIGRPHDYALFKAYKGEKRTRFLQSMLKGKRAVVILMGVLLAVQFPQLHVLKLSKCLGVTDEGLKQLVGSHKLQVLVAEVCPQISADMVSFKQDLSWMY